MSEDEFDQQTFIAAAQMFNLPFRYGLPQIIDRPDTVSIVMLRASLITHFRTLYPDCTIYQIEATYDEVKSRLLLREQSGEASGDRLTDFETELTLGRQLADRIFVNDSSVEQLYQDIVAKLHKDFPAQLPSEA